MDINATLLGQMLVFGILIWFSWKYIWPPLVKAVDDRQKKIAEGLAAAERGQKELQQSHGDAAEIVNEAREKALKIVDAGEPPLERDHRRGAGHRDRRGPAAGR